MPKRNIVSSFFDIRPNKEIGPLTVNLRYQNTAISEEPVEEIINDPTEVASAEFTPIPRGSLVGKLLGESPRANHRDIVTREVEDALGQENIVADLVRVGGTLHTPKAYVPTTPTPVLKIPKKAEYKEEVVEKKEDPLELFWTTQESATPISVKIEDESPKGPLKGRIKVANLQKQTSPRRLNFPRMPVNIKTVFVGAALLLVLGVAFALFNSNQIVAKESVLKNGNQAVLSLENAKENLEELKFSEAADSFALAHDDFDKASKTLSSFGASILSFFGDIPGFGKIRSANNLLSAGKHISESGEDLSRAFADLYATNIFSFLRVNDSSSASLYNPLTKFRKALEEADENIAKANQLLLSVRADDIPEDKREAFEAFREKTPDFQKYIAQALDYSDFLLKFVGESGQKTYMVLFQNTSERRPTGGFPGSYGIVVFEKGELKKLFVDDIYNPDGQAKVNYIPPIPLQHITPTLGMRDVAWFADFPTSARKVEEYYLNNGGPRLDGVISITPAVITKILRIVGPIEMPEYDVTLTADNFLPIVQDHVEIISDREQPKKILMDFQPKLFEVLAKQNQETWIEIAKVLQQSLSEKEILAYFKDSQLQNQAVIHGFSGEIIKSKGDYLQVAFSNVKGSKTDAVTSNASHLTTVFEIEKVQHTLVITRSHNGGKTEYPFYNKENSSYVKVYVPQGSILESISDHSIPNYKPLVSSKDLGFKPDQDITKVESSITNPVSGVDVFTESGMTVFGFWMNTKPQASRSVRITYTTPLIVLDGEESSYSLYWQKQSGAQGDKIHVSVKLPEGKTIKNFTPDKVQILGSTAVYDAELSVDRELNFVFN